jgi:hypothetical protein
VPSLDPEKREMLRRESRRRVRAVRREARAEASSRRAVLALVAVLLMVAVIALIAARPSNPAEGHRRVVGEGQIAFDGHGPEWWAQRWRREHERVSHLSAVLRRQRRVLLSAPRVVEAINLAAAVYGDGSTLWRKARCESGLNPQASNPSGADGLFQFLGSTWRSTPFAGFSVWSPYANALAAGWMHEHGRGGEWSCR